MSPVDQYIRRATAGLPGRTRVDTAAELRVHLNQRISQFRQEGFEQTEAEHLALQQMGPPEPVNRSFLGHILTPRVGWAVLSVLVLGTGAWFTGNYLFAPAEIVQARQLTVDELLPLMGDFASVQVTLPPDVQLFATALVQGDAPMYQDQSNFADQTEGLRPNQRTTLPLTLGLLNPGLAAMPCEDSTYAWISLEGSRSRSESCVALPSNNGSWRHLAHDSPRVSHDTWIPLLVFQPTIRAESTMVVEGQQVTGWTHETAEQDSWLVYSMYVSRTPLGDANELTPAPTASELVQRYRWLAR